MLRQPRIGRGRRIEFLTGFHHSRLTGGFALYFMIDHVSVSGESIKTSVYPLESPTHYQYQAHSPYHPNTSKAFPIQPNPSHPEDLSQRLLNMKIFTIAAACLFAAVAYTAPAPVEDRQFRAQITFFGGPAQVVQSVPTDGSVFQIGT